MNKVEFLEMLIDEIETKETVQEILDFMTEQLDEAREQEELNYLNNEMEAYDATDE
jgi:hypothetical protein